jgi:hypothetical protein
MLLRSSQSDYLDSPRRGYRRSSDIILIFPGVNRISILAKASTDRIDLILDWGVIRSAFLER